MGGVSTETFSLCEAAEQQNADIPDQNTTNSSEMASDAAEDSIMKDSSSAEKSNNKAESRTDGPNLGATAPQANQAGNSYTDTPEEMEVSDSAGENDVKAGKQPEEPNLGATPSQVVENTSPELERGESQRTGFAGEDSRNTFSAKKQFYFSTSDNPTPMNIHEQTEDRKGKRRHSEQSGSSKHSRAEGTRKSLMKCPNCPAAIAPSVTFCKQKNDQYIFDIGLHQDSLENHNAFFKDKLDWTKQPAVTNVSRQCPNCQHSFNYKSVASRTNKMGGFDIELSINISKEDKLEPVTAGTEHDDMDDSSSEKSTGGTQPQNGNCDKGMVSSEKSTGRNTDKPFLSRVRDSFSNLTESGKSSSRKPEQLNQTNSEGWSIGRISSFFKSSPPVVKVHYTPTSDTFGADAAIMKKLKNNLNLVETTSGNCSVIVVFCPVSRSFESEIRSAMEKEAVSSCGKPVILVLMHHTRDPDYSTAGCDPSEMLKNVFYVHVFYHETEKGLLRCNQNDRAIEAIERKLQIYQQ